MGGCRTLTERPDPSLILMQRRLKVLQHPGYQENMVSVGICKVLIFLPVMQYYLFALCIT